jgi:hypothetical protein
VASEHPRTPLAVAQGHSSRISGPPAWSRGEPLDT